MYYSFHMFTPKKDKAEYIENLINKNVKNDEYNEYPTDESIRNMRDLIDAHISYQRYQQLIALNAASGEINDLRKDHEESFAKIEENRATDCTGPRGKEIAYMTGLKDALDWVTGRGVFNTYKNTVYMWND